ncbi:MAG: putative esterase [Cellvibrionaceae bacterium]|jgi:predicted esterase
MLGGFRNSKEHVSDIDHVIRNLQTRKNVPVWLIGTSRGTESSANIAIHSSEKTNGLVLTSSMTVENGNSTPLTEMNLKKVTMPTLVLAHTENSCSKAPPSGAEKIASMLIDASQVEVKSFSGGKDLLSNPCNTKTYHGFWEIETKVVDHISNFIKSN